MTTAVPSLRRLTPQAAILLLAAAVAWLVTAGYLLAWAGAGIPAFLLTALVARLVGEHPAWATAVAVTVFAACGVYQLTPLKSRCLKHCRSPLSLLLAEKLWAHGELLARVVGVAALALAVAVIWVPDLAPGLHGAGQIMSAAPTMP